MPDGRPSAVPPAARFAVALVAAAVLGAVATGASLLVNNRRACCDMLNLAGFPAPFYGGGGGFVGGGVDRLQPAALVFSGLWWFGLVLATVLVVAGARRAGARALNVCAGVGVIVAAFVVVAIDVAARAGLFLVAFDAIAGAAAALVAVVVAVAVAVGRLV